MHYISIVISIVLALSFTVTCYPQDIQISSRIHNGTTVNDIKQFKYQVGIKMFDQSGNTFWCGGSIIAKNVVLTAAHCLKDINKATLYFGTIDRHNDIKDSGSIRVDVQANNFTIHEGYDKNMKKDDIALIKLKTPISFSDKIGKIELVPNRFSHSKFDNKYVVISGWGQIKTDDTSSVPKLQHGKVKILPHSECLIEYADHNVLTNKHICAAAHDNIGVCKGDSGGPMVAEENGAKFQVGIAAFMKTNTCSQSDSRVFVRVSEYLPWICHYVDSLCQVYFPDD